MTVELEQKKIWVWVKQHRAKKWQIKRKQPMLLCSNKTVGNTFTKYFWAIIVYLIRWKERTKGERMTPIGVAREWGTGAMLLTQMWLIPSPYENTWIRNKGGVIGWNDFFVVNIAYQAMRVTPVGLASFFKFDSAVLSPNRRRKLFYHVRIFCKWKKKFLSKQTL